MKQLERRHERNDNILYDFISDVYETCLENIREKHPEAQVLSWVSLTRLAKKKPQINTYIQQEVTELGFTPSEWEALRKLKATRNANNHERDIAEAKDIVQNQLIKNQQNEPLRSAMLRVFGICENSSQTISY